MAFDIKSTIRKYIETFPGSFSGFLYILADILITISDEWREFGKDKWADALYGAATNLRKTAQDLSIVAAEHDKEFP